MGPLASDSLGEDTGSCPDDGDADDTGRSLLGTAAAVRTRGEGTEVLAGDELVGRPLEEVDRRVDKSSPDDDATTVRRARNGEVRRDRIRRAEEEPPLDDALVDEGAEEGECVVRVTGERVRNVYAWAPARDGASSVGRLVR